MLPGIFRAKVSIEDRRMVGDGRGDPDSQSLFGIGDTRV